MGNGKGALYKHLGDYVARKHGAGAWRELVARQPAADRAVFDGLLLVGGWWRATSPIAI